LLAGLKREEALAVAFELFETFAVAVEPPEGLFVGGGLPALA